MSAWEVYKFGGSSLRDAQALRTCAHHIKDEINASRKLAVVVSAMGGLTDTLQELVESNHPLKILAGIEERFDQTLQDLFEEGERGALEEALASDLKQVQVVLEASKIARHVSQQNREFLLGLGEVWTARVFAALLTKTLGHPCPMVDAREFLVASPSAAGALPHYSESESLLKGLDLGETPVFTGFVARSPQGIPTTLGRNGSDHTATILSKLLGAQSVTIWTDVNGIFSADPRRVRDARVLPEVTYREAAELGYFGAKVIHPLCILPAQEASIPIHIRNTFHAERPGTTIHAQATSTHSIRGLTTKDSMALLNIEGSGLVGVPGMAERLFRSLSEVGVSIVLISQASSEHSICLAIPQSQGTLAQQTAHKAFKEELESGTLDGIELLSNCSILAAVGDDMVERPGVAGKFFNSLARAGVNVRAIAQGSSERNLSAVVDSPESTKALQAAHSGFYLSDQTLSVGLVGAGLIGNELLKQIQAQKENLRQRFKLDLRVRAIVRSKEMALLDGEIDLNRWKGTFEQHRELTDLDRLTSHIQAPDLPHSVLIDCTASEDVAKLYPAWLRQGIHIITPNKKASSGSIDHYCDLKEAEHESGRQYYYEATVGAGLPIMGTLKDLIQTGDRLISIEGVFSGTLSHIFNSFDGTVPFSSIVKSAREEGYTEPDPRDDLSGMDVARKVVILAREMGLQLELGQVPIHSLIPKELQGEMDVETFLDRLPEFDGEMEEVLKEAQAKGRKLCYLGRVDASSGQASVQLEGVDGDHPFAGLRGSDNIVAFRTGRYDKQPLIVRGPGAGPAVTSAGVFADLLRLSSYLGANR